MSVGSVLDPQERDGVIVVRFRDRILVGGDEAQRIEQELNRMVEQHPGARLAVDFEGVQALSSSVLGSLVAVHRRLVQRGGRLVLCNLHRRVAEIFNITRLSDLFSIHPDAGAAVAVLRQ